MEIDERLPSDRQVVEAYGGGGFRVSGQRYEGSVLVLPERTTAWATSAVEAIEAEALTALLVSESGPVDILILGCGARMTLVPKALREALRDRGIAVEAMDTGAACRTYNVLLNEERVVAAALIAVD